MPLLQITGLDITTQPADLLRQLVSLGVVVYALEIKYGCSAQSGSVRATAAAALPLPPGVKLCFELQHSVPAPTDGDPRCVTVEAATSERATVSPSLPVSGMLRIRVTAHRRGSLQYAIRPTRKFLAVVLERLWSGSAQLLNVVSDDIPKKKGVRAQQHPANIVSGFFAEATSEEAAAAIVQRCHGRRLVLLGQPFLLLAEFARPGRSGCCYDKQADGYEGNLRRNMMAEWAAAAGEAERLPAADDDVEMDRGWFVQNEQAQLSHLVNEPIAPDMLAALGLAEHSSRFEAAGMLSYLDLCTALPQHPGDDDMLQEILGDEAGRFVQFLKTIVQEWPAARQYHAINPEPANQVLAAAERARG